MKKKNENLSMILKVGIAFFLIIITALGLYFALPLMPLSFKFISIIVFLLSCLMIGFLVLIYIKRSNVTFRIKSVSIGFLIFGLLTGSIIFIGFLSNIPRYLHNIQDAHIYSSLILDLKEVVNEYIKQNNGKFPSGEEDLLNQEFLKKEKTPSGFRYSVNLDSEYPELEANWSIIPDGYFESLEINYGLNINQIKVVDSSLYNEDTKEQLLLINGPKQYRGYYKAASITWYNSMLHYQQNKK